MTTPRLSELLMRKALGGEMHSPRMSSLGDWESKANGLGHEHYSAAWL